MAISRNAVTLSSIATEMMGEATPGDGILLPVCAPPLVDFSPMLGIAIQLAALKGQVDALRAAADGALELKEFVKEASEAAEDDGIPVRARGYDVMAVIVSQMTELSGRLSDGYDSMLRSCPELAEAVTKLDHLCNDSVAH